MLISILGRDDVKEVLCTKQFIVILKLLYKHWLYKRLQINDILDVNDFYI